MCGPGAAAGGRRIYAGRPGVSAVLGLGMRFAARRSVPLTVGLLGAFGLLIGLALVPTITYYGSMDPQALPPLA
jgi:hypothetical protein